jgi:15-cis-phytoene synthase
MLGGTKPEGMKPEGAKREGMSPEVVSPEGMSPEVVAAYATCRAIAREKAKNFYYAFVALPREKRNAICAVYAFMRHADDLCDDESVPHSERRISLDHWLERWHQALGGAPTPDPVFVALIDAQKRFAIPSQLLDQLVEGTAMDLGRDEKAIDSIDSSRSAYDTYETFEELYQYCYLVASIVGLVCIRIFGYEEKQAEKLAEETGIAFQLTNILRDVREDAERGRVYLPLEDMRGADLSPEQLAGIRDRRGMPDGLPGLLQFESQRAEAYYRSGQKLLPLVAADSRAALWVLIEIYHRLLRRIEQSKFDVFSRRISVPTHEKLTILGRGLLKTMLNRARPVTS